MSGVGDLVANLSLNSRGFSSGLNQSRASLASFGASVGSTIAAGVAGFGALVGAGGAVASMGMGVKLAADAEQAKVAFDVMLGGADKAEDMMKRLTDFANHSPFEMVGVTESAKKLINFGIAGEDVLPTMKMLGDVAMGDSEKLDSLSLVFGQMSSAGRLMGQDLLQFINAGFNPLQEMSESTGISMGALKKAMEGGGISAQMVKDSFKRATSEGGKFFGMTERQSQTLGGKFSTMKDSVTGALRTMGEELATQFNLKGMLDNLTSVFNQAPEIISSAFSRIGPIVSGYFSAVSASWNAVMQSLGFDNVMDAFSSFGEWALSTFEWIGEGLTSQAEWWGETIVYAIETSKAAFSMFYEAADGALKALGESIGVHMDMTTAVAGVQGATDAIPMMFRNATPLIETTVIDWNLALFDLIPGAEETMGTVGSILIATWDGVGASFGTFIQNVMDGFMELGNIAQAVWEGIKATFSSGSFEEGFQTAMKKFASQAGSNGKHFTETFSESFNQTLSNATTGLAEQGGLGAALRGRKEQLLNDINTNEEQYQAEANAKAEAKNQANGNAPDKPTKKGDKKKPPPPAFPETTKSNGGKSENSAAFIGSQEAAKLLQGGGAAKLEDLTKQGNGLLKQILGATQENAPPPGVDTN